MYGDCRACYRIKRYEQMLSKGSRTVLRLHLFIKSSLFVFIIMDYTLSINA